ncbi:histidine phosphatase family protein [Lactobacillus selangorensis]|nr:histidine phosphatase family protein [Lactobacillus selangorensis]
MTKLFFVRHGKTQWNLEGRYQGAHGDSPLLPESYAEIGQLAKYLDGTKFAHIYTSPLPRAVDTAETLAKDLKQDVPVTIAKGLREFDLGAMEGMRFTDVEAKYPEELHAFRHAPADYHPEKIHGETFQQLIDRMTPTIEKIVHTDQTGTENLILVSHGAALAAEIQHLLGTPIKDLRKDGGLTNSSVTVLETNDDGKTFQLIRWNETSYLHRKLMPSDTI